MKLNEMVRLIAMLQEAGIPHEVVPHWSGTKQLCYPERYSSGNCVCDAVSFDYSYGGKEGLLEIMGLTEDEGEVEGWLTAEEVFSRIQKHYQESGTTTYTYDNAASCYTSESNDNMDFIVRNLPGVKIVREEESFVQITADKRAAEILDFLSDCDMLCCWKGKTVDKVKAMLAE